MIYLSVNHVGYCEVIKDGVKCSKSVASFLELYLELGFLCFPLRILLVCGICPNGAVVGLRLEV